MPSYAATSTDDLRKTCATNPASLSLAKLERPTNELKTERKQIQAFLDELPSADDDREKYEDVVRMNTEMEAQVEGEIGRRPAPTYESPAPAYGA
ncbi:hypothetical protein TruAng_000227 [Truncatella angustata]|nr:hypothetical protein TruAng_000227 [Truncatella angustata]